MNEFVEVGSAGFHDARIISVNKNDDNLVVKLKCLNEKEAIILFKRVREVKSNKPEGMLLYSLNQEVRLVPPFKFTFVNWYFDEPESAESSSTLEVTADEIKIIDSE